MCIDKNKRLLALTTSCTGGQDFKKLLKELDPENGHVLVYHPQVYGMYIQYHYARVSESEFRKIVETGVIKPKRAPQNGSAREVMQVGRARSVSQRLSALKVRISAAKLAVDICHLVRQSGAAGNDDGQFFL